MRAMNLAYIDPGTGSIILQSLIAAILGVLIFFRDWVKRIFKLVFARKAKPEEKPATDQPASPPQDPVRDS